MWTIHTKSFQLHDKGIPHQSFKWNKSVTHHQQLLSTYKALFWQYYIWMNYNTVESCIGVVWTSEEGSQVSALSLRSSHCVGGSFSAPLGGPGVTCASLEQAARTGHLLLQVGGHVVGTHKAISAPFYLPCLPAAVVVIALSSNSPSDQKAKPRSTAISSNTKNIWNWHTHTEKQCFPVF